MFLYPPVYPMPPIPCGKIHPGAFGVKRKHDVHCGVDLYTPRDTPIKAITSGRVIQVKKFTGASVGMPWWNETMALYVFDGKRIIVYGEIDPIVVGSEEIVAGDCIGYVLAVLKESKGRPMSMLHVETYDKDALEDMENWRWNWQEWKLGYGKPKGLTNPTKFLLDIPGATAQYLDPYKKE